MMSVNPITKEVMEIAETCFFDLIEMFREGV